ncbi:unnamed protein product [Trichogramma brassicae]|uniref:CCHC-type domain-containing protein n=1 Tax=Trichogramma brassicae TaxID=86971 RepID=A0A6H5IZ27_9HYME|nr:unnamed protein product [Trichogramma brassicae]
MHDGQQDRQAPGSNDEVGETSHMESSSLPSMPTKTMTPFAMIAASMTRRIIGASLLAKDAPLPTPAEFATGSYEEKMIRLERLMKGLNTFIFGRNNLHKEVIKYSLSLEQAILALKKTKQKQVPPRPPSAEKAVCTSPIFSVNAIGKRPATSPLATHATPKRHAVAAASKQPDENNNDVGDQDEFVPVNHRRHREHKQTATTTAGSVHTWQLSKPRPAQRRVHHRPDAIVIKAKDASTRSSVQNIRRSAAGALVLQLKKNVDNASTLGAKLDQVLGDAATATARQHTTMIEIRDLDECATKEKIAEALSTSLGAPSLNKEVVRTLRKAYAGTQAAVTVLPDDLDAKALKLGHIRIGWVNCRIRGRKDALRCYRCWSPGHVSARFRGPDRSGHCFCCGQAGHQIKNCKKQPNVCSLPRTRRCPRPCVHRPVLPSCTEEHSSPPMMRIVQLNLNHCKAAQGLLSQAIREQRINVAIVCDQYKNHDPPYTWLTDANSQAAIWVQGDSLVQEHPARARRFFTWARISGIYFFSVYAPPRLAHVEFSALLTNITEEARGKRPLIIAGDFNAWSTEWGCRATRQRVTTLLDALAPLEAVLLNTENTPTLTG